MCKGIRFICVVLGNRSRQIDAKIKNQSGAEPHNINYYNDSIIVIITKRTTLKII